jgi:hypothetical protein
LSGRSVRHAAGQAAMIRTSPRDLTLPLIPDDIRRNQGPVPLAAYVPLTVALIGVAIILAGGLGSRGAGVQTAQQAPVAATVDTVVTGSVKP